MPSAPRSFLFSDNAIKPKMFIALLVSIVLLFSQYVHASHDVESKNDNVKTSNHHCKILHQDLDTPKNNNDVQVALEHQFLLYFSCSFTVIFLNSDFVTPFLRAPPIIHSI